MSYTVGDQVKFQKERSGSFGYGVVIKKYPSRNTPGDEYVIKTKETHFYKIDGQQNVNINVNYISNTRKNTIISRCDGEIKPSSYTA